MDNIDNSIVEIRPKQRVSYAEKQKPEWQKNNVTFWASKCVSNFFTNKDLLVLYKAAAGVLEEEDYTYITNPLNAVQTELKGYPAKMRNIDIISTNINVLRGELLDRFFNPVVVALNADIDNKKYQEELLRVMIHGALHLNGFKDKTK